MRTRDDRQRSQAATLRDCGTLYLSDWSGVYHHDEDLEIEEVMETPEVTGEHE